MPSSVISNCVFCGLSALLFLPLLRSPRLLTYKNGICILPLFVLILIKFLLPYEFSFTYTLPSLRLLPHIRDFNQIQLLPFITVGTTILILWIVVASIKAILFIYKNRKMAKLFAMLPHTQDDRINQVLSDLCTQLNLTKPPKIVCFDSGCGPFLCGLFSPTIVLPNLSFSEQELYFILNHELEHLKHHHLLLKSVLEIVSIIYWWNPVIWIFKFYATRALELQADTFVIQTLSSEQQFSYLETLIIMSKKFCYRNVAPALSFSLQPSTSDRIQTILKEKESKHRFLSVSFAPFICFVILFFFSFAFIFEAATVNPKSVEGTFTITKYNSYLILQKDQSYDLYVDDEWIINLEQIPREMKDLTVYSESGKNIKKEAD